MIYDDKKFIGNKIKQYRKKMKLTQAQLAEKVGLSDKHIGRIEAGVFYPTCNSFMHLIDILNIDISEFGVHSSKIKNPKFESVLRQIYSLNEKELDVFLNISKEVLSGLKIVQY
ncbi:helix-turn-helix transcriptional regulator [bacterium]|nr:helix-turn-helix transcriptional regulator [bacterium]